MARTSATTNPCGTCGHPERWHDDGDPGPAACQNWGCRCRGYSPAPAKGAEFDEAKVERLRSSFGGLTDVQLVDAAREAQFEVRTALKCNEAYRRELLRRMNEAGTTLLLGSGGFNAEDATARAYDWDYETAERLIRPIIGGDYWAECFDYVEPERPAPYYRANTPKLLALAKRLRAEEAFGQCYRVKETPAVRFVPAGRA